MVAGPAPDRFFSCPCVMQIHASTCAPSLQRDAAGSIFAARVDQRVTGETQKMLLRTLTHLIASAVVIAVASLLAAPFLLALSSPFLGR